MRRKDILDGLNQIQTAINESGIMTVLEATFEAARSSPDRTKFRPELLKALKQYSLFAHNYNEAAREAANILELNELEDEVIWEGLLHDDTLRTLFRQTNNLRFVLNHLPRFTTLLHQTPQQIVEQFDGEIGRYKGMKVLTVIVFEESNIFSRPARLANVLESIDHFYTACALMNEESPSSLSVIACDSGSDKSFDFLGLAKIVECVERIIGTIWDRLVFYKERKFDERLDLVTKALPIIEHISKLEEQKQIDPELAEILRRNVIDGANKFVQSGATLPQLDQKAYNPPRLLLTPVQKLLVSAPIEQSTPLEASDTVDGSPAPVRTAEGDNSRPTINVLSAEEREQLLQLLIKTQSKESSSATIMDVAKPTKESIETLSGETKKDEDTHS